MAMAGGAVPAIFVLALGAGALGGPDALRLLIAVAGRNRNPAFDIGIVVFLISMFAVQLLGTLLLARYVRKAPPAGAAAAGGGRGAPAADPFARITLLMSLAAASLVTACLVIVSGGPGSLRPLADFAADYFYNPTVIAAAGVAIPNAAPLLRVLREQRNARGRAARAERATTTQHAARFTVLPLAAAAAALVVGIPSGVRGGLDALRLSPGFTDMAVAAAAVGAALLLLVRFYRSARNAAIGGDGGAAPGAAAAAPRTRGASAR
ncbi:unnamed protein product [Urochloa humidicola]